MRGSNSSQKQSLTAGEIYLVLYNVLLTIGWASILFIAVKTFTTWQSTDEMLAAKNLYRDTELFLQIFQTAALLEVVHAAIGLVRSNAMLVLFQVLSRLLVVWLVTFAFEPARHNIGVFIVCIAWPIAEIVRYIYYALNILGSMPHFITWCRYTFFIVLYPIGVTGELICIYNAVKYLEPLSVRKQFSYNLPNKFNISFDMYYALIFSMLLYIPIFPMLYNHMRAQRRKILGASSSSSKKSTKIN